MRKFIALAVVLCGVISASAAELAGPECIIPKVASFEIGKGSFTLEKGASFSITAPAAEKEALQAFKDYLGGCELTLTEAAAGKKAAVIFKITGKTGKEESYGIVIGKKNIAVTAPGLAGAFYAVQSLIQMSIASQGGTLPCCKINDTPHYGHRGLMFDLSRHFWSKDFILKQLDLMALVKMNRLHLHLTDDQGWRIALDCAPEMTAKGAFGNSDYYHSFLTRSIPLKFTDAPSDYVSGTVYDDRYVYGGYYSKDDIREIIDYAAVRHIEIIPEIEIPGHNKALLAVHPEFFCAGKHFVENVVCAGLDEPLEFFEKVLGEIMDLFPSEYIHIGGDEASKANWIVCDRCRERIASEGLKDEFELQIYIIRKVEKIINKRGRHLIGWDEILEGGLSDNATVMSWRGTAGGIKAIEMNHDVIMTPNSYCYLDYSQDAPYKEPLAFNTYLPLETVYGYNPDEEVIKACGEDVDLKHLLGIQGNLWAECIIDPAYYEYMLYPRAFAIAETGWSPEDAKDFPSFRANALELSKWLSRKGYHPFDLSTEVGERPESKVRMVTLTDGAKAQIRVAEGKAEDASIFVDGYLGGWSSKDANAWRRIRRKEATVDIDLGAVKDIHYLGVEFIDYGIRRFRVPQDVEFFVSTDGVNYRNADIPQVRLSADRKTFQIVTVGGTVSEKARFVRLHFNGSAYKTDSFLGEIIVN